MFDFIHLMWYDLLQGGVIQTMSQKKSAGYKAARFFLCTFITLIVMFVMGVSVFAIWIFSDSDFSFIDEIKDNGLKLNSTIYSLDKKSGKYVEYAHIQSEENRIWINIDSMPPDMQNAIVAIEDERFYHHKGVDIKRTAGAVIKELTGGSTYGGSTLTQQLIKNLTGDKEHSKARKIREMVRAVALEKRLDKTEILELYLNTVYFGQNCYGVETAANRYFGIHASDLSLAQSASLAGITQYPAEFDPITNPEKNEKKRKLVLDKMLELEYISQDEYDEAINTKLEFTEKDTMGKHEDANSYFTDYIIEKAISDIMKTNGCTKEAAAKTLNNGGLKIYATIDTDIQSAMDEEYKNDNAFIKNSKGERVQSAMVISDPYTGQIKGMIGGIGKKTGKLVLNRAWQSVRQPGSSIKPLSIYGPALDTGIYNASSTINDKPLKIGKWEPKNDSRTFTGSMSMRRAIMKSQNIPAINIGLKLTPEVSYEYLTEKMHFSSLTDDDKNLASMALGGMTHGVSVLEMTAAYSSIVNGGQYHEPIAYTKITDSAGNTIIDNTKTKSNKVFSEDAAFILCDIMKGVVTSGTGYGAKINNMDTAGKTGTTDNDTNRWFAGFTPYYCGVTWYGYDTPQRIYGISGNPSLKIWKRVMDKIHKDLKAKEFEKPDTVKKVTICPISGKLATSRCNGVSEYVTRASKPSSYCTSHNVTKSPYELSYTPSSSSSEKDNKKNNKNKTDENGSSENENNTQNPSGPGGATTPPSTPSQPSSPSTPSGTGDKPIIDLTGQ